MKTHYEFKKPNNPPIKTGAIKIYTYGGNGYTVYDGLVYRERTDVDDGNYYSYYVKIKNKSLILLGTYSDARKLTTYIYRRRDNTPKLFYWDYHTLSQQVKEDHESGSTRLAAEAAKTTSLLIGNREWRGNIYNSVKRLLDWYKASEVIMKFSKGQVKAIAQMLINEGYPADLDGGLGKLKQTIRLIVNQDKADHWHDGVPNDKLINHLEEEAKKEIDENETLSNHRLESALNYNSKLLQRLEATNVALVLMNNEINDQKEINNELKKKLQVKEQS